MIRDVAFRAGVSPMTLSRVTDGEENVRPQTRNLVRIGLLATAGLHITNRSGGRTRAEQ